jgi:hypothetical protein
MAVRRARAVRNRRDIFRSDQGWVTLDLGSSFGNILSMPRVFLVEIFAERGCYGIEKLLRFSTVQRERMVYLRKDSLLERA